MKVGLLQNDYCHNCIDGVAEVVWVGPANNRHAGKSFPVCRKCRRALEAGEENSEIKLNHNSCCGAAGAVEDEKTWAERAAEQWLSGIGSDGTTRSRGPLNFDPL